MTDLTWSILKFIISVSSREHHAGPVLPQKLTFREPTAQSTVRRIQRLQFTWLSCHGDGRCATSQNAWASVVIFSGQEKASAGCLSRPYFGAWQGTVPFPRFCPTSFCLHSAHVQRRGKTGCLLADAITRSPYPRLCWELSPALAWPGQH